MFPISHSDDTMDLGNLDGTDVPEHHDESRTANQELNSCCGNKSDSITGHIPDKSVDKTAVRNNKSTTQRQASARYRYAGRNRSSFSVEKHRDHRWRSERSDKMDNRCQKVPSNAGDREHTSSLDKSDELTNVEDAAAESAMQTVSHCSGDNGTEVLTETMDPTNCDASISKPVMPPRHRQNSSDSYRGKFNTHGRSRFSGASYSKYSNDRDDYVVQPKNYRDHKSNTHQKSVNKATDADADDARNDLDEDFNRDHPACSSAVSTKNNDDYVSQPKHYRDHKSNRQPKLVKTAAAVAVSSDARNDFGEDSNLEHTACNSAVSSKYSDDYVSQPKHYRCHKTRRPPKSTKAATDAVSKDAINDSYEDSNCDHAACNPAVSTKYSDEHYRDPISKRQPKSAQAGDDARNDFDEDAKDSHLRHAVCSSGVSTNLDSAVASGSKENKTQFSDTSCRTQRDGYRSRRNNKDRPTYTTLEDSSPLPARAASTQQCRNNSSDIGNSLEMKSRRQNHWPRKHWDKKAPDKGRRSSVDSDEQLQKTADALSHLSVEVRKGDDDRLEPDAAEMLKDSNLLEQECTKQSNVHQTSTFSSSGQGTRSQGRRNNRNRRDDARLTKEPMVTLEDSSPLTARAAGTQQCHNNSSHTGNSTEMKSRRQNHWPRKHWDRKAPDKGRRSSVDSEEQLQKTADALSHLSVEVRKGDDDQLQPDAAQVMKDSSLSEQQCMKQSNVHQRSTYSSSSQGTRSQRRRNNRNRRDDAHLTKELMVPGYQQCGPDRANGSSRVQTKYSQRNGGSHCDARRNSRPGNCQNSYDNESNCVERPPESPIIITRCDNERPPGFCVQHRPASATVQLPTS